MKRDISWLPLLTHCSRILASPPEGTLGRPLFAGANRPAGQHQQTSISGHRNGCSAARATTLVNVARALGMEMMLIPQAMVPAVQSMLQPVDDDDDRPAFTSDVEEVGA